MIKYKRLLFLLLSYFILLLGTNLSLASNSKEYKSIIVVGHLYPIYKIYRKNGDYLNKQNLRILSKSINSISNISQIIFLGDTYENDSDETYKIVKEELLDTLIHPLTLIHGNHETPNLKKFNQSGGVARKLINIDTYRLIMFSPWRLEEDKLRLKISDGDISYLKTSLSKEKHNIILITDMVHHKNARLSRWKDRVVPLLKKNNVRYVVVGDNDRVQHKYSWVKLDGIYYIHQGIAQNSIMPGINTYLEIRLYKKGQVKFIPHAIPFDGLSDVYEMEADEFINEKVNCKLCSYIKKIF
jgi:hypothetical protein